MSFFLITNEDRERIKRLSQDKSLIFALKKYFMNAAFERPASNEVNFLAARTIALVMLYDIFHDLEVSEPVSRTGLTNENVV